MSRLVEEFINEECLPDIVIILKESVEKHINTGKVKEYNFNRFNIFINFNNSVVTIEDDLDPEPSGKEDISLPSFLDLLKQQG